MDGRGGTRRGGALAAALAAWGLLNGVSAGATWTATGAGPLNWTDAANWGGTAPAAGEALSFTSSGSGVQTVNNDFAAGTNFGLITQKNRQRTYQGNAVVLDAGIDMQGGTSTWDIAITLSAPQTFTATANQMMLSNTINLNGHELTFSGGTWRTDSAGKITGSGGIRQIGGDEVILGADSSDYTGQTVVVSGRLQANGGGVLGAAGAGNETVIEPLGTLRTAGRGYTMAEPFILKGGTLNIGNSGGAVTQVIFTGQFTLFAGTDSEILTNIGAGYDRTQITGLITGAGAFTKGGAAAGSNTLELLHANDYSGGTTVTTGTLLASVAGALGTGDVTVEPGAMLDLQAAGAIGPDAVLYLLEDAGLCGQAYLGADQEVLSLSLGGALVPAGTYTAGDYPDYLLGAGSITVREPAAAVEIPEPASALLVLAGAGLVARRRRRA